ncbi:hypothetical protein C7999DRAFT_13802, partial [Corynascus novoguineensis]
RQTAGLVAPAAFLFRPARPADSGNGIGAAHWSRQLEEATCGPDETICPQGGWCCGAGETCSLSNGAFFCCPAGADTAGCVRVCAAGDFQCGSICCANGQMCMAADSLSPYCVNESRISVSSTATSTSTTFSSVVSTSTSSVSRTTSISVSTSVPSISSTGSGSSTVSKTSLTLTLSPTSTDQPSSTGTSTTTATPQNGGFPHAAQIAVGVVVPVVVILLVGALWFFVFRRPNQGHGRGHHRRGTGGSSFGFGTGSQGNTPPPAYDKNGTEVFVGPPSSLHEQYLMESNTERAGEGAGVAESLELANLGEVGSPGSRVPGDGTLTREGARSVSPLSHYSGDSRGRMSPHPGNVVVV